MTVEGRPFSAWWLLYWECHHPTGTGAARAWRTLDGRPALEQRYPLVQIFGRITQALREAAEAEKRRRIER